MLIFWRALAPAGRLIPLKGRSPPSPGLRFRRYPDEPGADGGGGGGSDCSWEGIPSTEGTCGPMGGGSTGIEGGGTPTPLLIFRYFRYFFSWRRFSVFKKNLVDLLTYENFVSKF